MVVRVLQMPKLSEKSLSTRVADLAHWTPKLAILASFCDSELLKFCLGVFPNLA